MRSDGGVVTRRGKKAKERPASESLSLERQASGAVAWSLLNTFVSKLGTLAVGVALARMLGPEAFGTFAVAMVALMAVLSFNELGVSLAIVRWRGDPDRIVPTVTTISVAASTLLFAAGYLVTPTYATAMGDPGATGVVRLMLVSLLVNGFVASPAALMQRRFMQKQRMVIDQFNMWIGAILSIGLATIGMGAMSLAIGRVAGSVVSAAFFIRLVPEGLRFGFDRSLLRPLLRFGLPLAGSSAVMFAAGYADQLVTGSMLGPTQLGYYVLAFNLASWPVSMFSQPLRSVAPAAFARLQEDPERMTSSLRWIVGVLAAVAFPVCFFFAGSSQAIIDVVYGEQWAASAPILAWLGLVAALRIVFELAYDYLVVLGRSRSIFVIQIVWLVVLIPGLILGAALFGVRGVAAAQFLVALVLVLPLYLRQLSSTGLPAGSLLRRLILPLTAGVATWVGASLLASFVESAWLSSIGSGLLAVIVIALTLSRDGDVLQRLRDFRAVPKSPEGRPVT